MRIIITLACKDCKNRNYTTTKNKKEQERLELRKYCPACKKHTVHREVK
ncbi:MAG: 50S ribosomal protein L33 [candidate division WOR-3 bacterium]